MGEGCSGSPITWGSGFRGVGFRDGKKGLGCTD